LEIQQQETLPMRTTALFLLALAVPGLAGADLRSTTAEGDPAIILPLSPPEGASVGESPIPDAGELKRQGMTPQRLGKAFPQRG
jgi:hypothetical protein